VNGKILNGFDLRERFPEVGPLSRAAESNGAVPQECGVQGSTLDRVTAGKIIASQKRFIIGRDHLLLFS